MLYNDYTSKLLGLQGGIVTDVEESTENLTIYVEMERKPHNCPCCGTATRTIHDYRKQRIKDTPSRGKAVVILLRKRRYCCPHCGKKFYEEIPFLPKFHRMTTRLVEYIIDKLRNERSFTSVAKETKISVTTVIRVFDVISYPRMLHLPEALSIDEFKGNTWGEKYQCIITDPVHKTVLDILPERYSYYLSQYFNRYSKDERNQVKFFVSDMWKTYSDISDTWLKNAVKIVDKYHWIRQAIWAFEKIRKEEQKKFGADLRKYFKRSKSLLMKRFDSLKDEEKQQVNVMLYMSVNIGRAHWYKEKFLQILDCKNPDKAKEAMTNWIRNAENCGLKSFEKCAQTMRNWFTGIINSFNSPITNGFTEGCNNKIKVLKRNAYGYHNFRRFRNRILHIFSHQKLNTQQAAT